MMNMDYDDEYPTCENTYATLRIYHEEPEVITQTLKIEPTSIIKKGERRKAKNPRSVSEINGWFLESEYEVKSKDSRRHIDWIIDKLKPVKKSLKTLQNNGAKMDICCYWLSASGHGGPTVSPKQMANLVELNLEVWWDIYYFDDEAE